MPPAIHGVHWVECGAQQLAYGLCIELRGFPFSEFLGVIEVRVGDQSKCVVEGVVQLLRIPGLGRLEQGGS